MNKKQFSVNFKLQSTKNRVSPVQIIFNLNTKKLIGGYLCITKTTGISLKENDWDKKKKIPFDASLNKKLADLKDYLLNYTKSYQEFSDSAILQYHEKGYWQEVVENAVTRIIDGKHTNQELYSEHVRQLSMTNVIQAEGWVRKRINDFGFYLVDGFGNQVDLDRFFSGSLYKPEQMLKEKIQPIQSLPEQSISQKENEPVKIKSSGDNYPIPFWQYVEHVADKKVLRRKLNASGAKSYRQKLAARFKTFNQYITLGQMTDDISIEFFNYMEKDGMSANYFGNFKKWMKSVLRFAIIEEKLNLPNIEIRSSIYEVNKEEVFSPYLTDTRLKELLKIKFTPNEKHLEYVRDLCIIASNTGLTYGDVKQSFDIQDRLVNGQKVYFIRISREKNGTPAEIPLQDFVYLLLKKYNFKFKKLSINLYNQRIKHICFLAGFTENFVQQKKNIKTGKHDTVITPFYQLISSHTNRRSFCTNMYFVYKISPYVIMQISQHKKLENFMTYIKASATEKFIQFAEQTVLKDRIKNVA